MHSINEGTTDGGESAVKKKPKMGGGSKGRS